MSLVDDAFDNLKKSLEITQTESKTAARRHKEIRDHVRTEWDLDDDFLTGSYRRDTKTKKLKDVDIFVVINPNGAQGDLRYKPPATVLDRLVTLLKKKYDDVIADGFAVTIDFGSDDDVMSFDVAPAYDHPDGGYEIPNAGTGNWIRTNPKTHHELSTAKNKECDEKYVPFIKMIKGANRELEEPVSPSFLLEVMALELVKTPFGRYQDEVRWFIATAIDHLDDPWPDPAKLGPNVNTMTAAQRSAARSKLADVLAIAEEAIRLEDAGQQRAAIEEWRRLFGSRMPRPT
jgi:hypothetical protein